MSQTGPGTTSPSLSSTADSSSVDDVPESAKATFDVLIATTSSRARRSLGQLKRHATVGQLHAEAVDRAGSGLAAHVYDQADHFLDNDRAFGAWCVREQASHWGSSLELLRLANLVAVVINLKLDAEWHVSRRSPRLEALRELHARSIVTVSEIEALLLAGFPSGAHARWRTLHEIEVTATILQSAPQDIARRYRASSLVELAKHTETIDINDPTAPAGLDELRRRVATLLQRHGDELRRPNGWAVPIVGHKRVTFRDLEQAARLDTRRHAYSLASGFVHDGQRANVATLATDTPGELLIGPRFDGAAIPIWRTIWSADGITDMLTREVRRVTRDDLAGVWASAHLHLSVEADRVLRSEDITFAARAGRAPDLPPLSLEASLASFLSDVANPYPNAWARG